MRQPGGDGSFLKKFESFGVSDVVVVNKPGTQEETRVDLQAQVQAAKAFFEVDAPVWVGDQILVSDARGGSRTLYVTDVKVHDVRGAAAFAGMSHLEASFTESAPVSSRKAPATGQVFNAPVVVVSGGQAIVAWDGGTAVANHQETVSAGYEDLAGALARAIEYLSNSKEIEPEDREIGEEAARSALAEITKPEPDRKLVRQSLAALKGALTSAMNSASGSAAAELVKSLFVG